MKLNPCAGLKKFPELDAVSAYYYTVDMVIAHGGPEARGTVSTCLCCAVLCCAVLCCAVLPVCTVT